MESPKKIVLRAPNWLGEHVMAGTTYQGLRRLYPRAHISLLCVPRVAGLPWKNFFDQQIVVADRSIRGSLSLAQQLMEERYDLALSLPASTSSAYLFFLSRIPHRIGFAEPAAAAFYHHSLPWRGRSSGEHKQNLYQ